MNLRLFTFVLFFSILSGCQSTGSGIGSGPIKLSPAIHAFYQKYLARPDTFHFAVSPDGLTAGASYWPSGATPNDCEIDTGGVALRACNSHGRGPCKLFADGKNIVWQGPVYDATWVLMKAAPTGKAIAAEKGSSQANIDAETQTCKKKCEDRPYGKAATCKSTCTCYVEALQRVDYSKVSAYNTALNKKEAMDKDLVAFMVQTTIHCSHKY